MHVPAERHEARGEGVRLPVRVLLAPAWATYASVLRFAARARRDLCDLRPRDIIDLQSFLWVQGSDEYEE